MFWVLSNCSDVLTQIEESEVCHLTDWIELKGGFVAADIALQ